MDKRAALRILRRFRDALEIRGIAVQRLILYGSFIGGKQREGSDIDVVVISEDFEGKDYWERIDVLSDAIYEIFEPIEAVAMTAAEWENGESPVVEYAKNGEVVYAAG